MSMRIIILLLFLLPLTSLPLTSMAQTPGMSAASVLDIKARSISTLAFSPTLLRMVNAQNTTALDMDEIRERHREWSESERPTPFKVSLMRNEAGLMLEHLVQSHAGVSDAILTDRLGAAVAIYPISPGYWQGEDPAWRNAFHNGRVHVSLATPGDPRRQIAAPVIDRGEIVGVLMVGVNMTTLTSAAGQE